jgi:SAM-dependent methyltransferase
VAGGRPRFDPRLAIPRSRDSTSAGWCQTDSAPFLSYVESDFSANWIDQLGRLHEESSRTHFLDRWTRTAIVNRIGPVRRSRTIADGSLDAIVSANLMEHVPDQRALRELARVLRPHASAVIVVPAGPSIYNYYDRVLGRERRYRQCGSSSKRAGRPVFSRRIGQSMATLADLEAASGEAIVVIDCDRSSWWPSSTASSCSRCE